MPSFFFACCDAKSWLNFVCVRSPPAIRSQACRLPLSCFVLGLCFLLFQCSTAKSLPTFLRWIASVLSFVVVQMVLFFCSHSFISMMPNNLMKAKHSQHKTTLTFRQLQKPLCGWHGFHYLTRLLVCRLHGFARTQKQMENSRPFIGKFLMVGKGMGGYVTFAWQERAHTRITLMTHLPPLKQLRSWTNKRCFSNVLRCLNMLGAFSILFFLPQEVSWLQARVRCLQNTVWKTPFGIAKIKALCVIGSSSACHREPKVPPPPHYKCPI